ncbi:hypothetical protein ACIS_00309 [Anaplasma centrale str. Israel]|uniref:Uncharacterized protein n=1 Tax=Anaplasma centrale (strain Israel) TaxID=574556 RepID=D1ATU0_ANACI|nr:hypothetical protein [Anaplasma centrale]ACZ48968.1 hypothetical protein ACIS_00309 [Anaplasma centrale str. Israel]
MLFWDRWRHVFAAVAVALLLSGTPCTAGAAAGSSTLARRSSDTAREFKNTPVSTCRLGVQGVSLAEEVSDTSSSTPLLAAKLKVCGAWPACGTCVRMYEGDCRYVFPTFVMTYGVKDQTGPGKICACKALACNLPWDPSGWNRSCMQELGCFNKPLVRDAGPFCNVLPGRKRSAKVRFVPLEFSKQSFWRPGFVAIVESWEQDRESSKVLHRKVRKHIINPGRSSPVFEGIIGQKDEYEWHTKGWKDVKEEQEWAISEQEKSYSFSDGGVTHYLKARREQDAVCVRYYGNDEAMSTELFEECLPIPPMELPRIYQAYSLTDSVGRGYKRDEYIVQHCKSSAASRTEYRISNSKSDKYMVQFIRGENTVKSAAERLDLNNNSRQDESDRAFVQHLKKHTSGTNTSGRWVVSDEDGTWVIHEEKIVEKEDSPTLAEWYRQHITNTDRITRSSGFDTCERKLRECVQFGGKSMCVDIDNKSSDSRISSTLQLLRGTSSQKWKTDTSYYKHPVGAFFGYSSIDFMHQKITEIAKEHGGNANKVEFVGVAAGPNRELGGVCDKTSDDSGDSKCEYYVVKTGKPRVMCITGIGSGTDISDYEIANNANDGGISRTWLRKQPKMLRRYVLAGEGDDARRVVCDDRYSMNLQLLSQPILDSIVVKDGRFVVPKTLSGGTRSSGGKGNPCARADANTVYYYESGRFTTEPGSLTGCADLNTQYYAPGKKIEGCTYEYVSMDDYRPISLGGRVSMGAGYDLPSRVPAGDKAAEEGSDPAVKLQPLSLYDRGLCIDDFSRYWYEPEYKIESEKVQTVAKEYVVLKFEASSGNRITGTLPSQNNKWCQFYKIEAWGGGEAAAITDIGARRSGRPGQYVVGILRNPSCDGNYNCDVFAHHSKQHGIRISDLEFSVKVDIGEGGEHGKPKKEESHKQHPVKYVRTPDSKDYGANTGAGGDTVVKFCVQKKSSARNQNGAQNGTQHSQQDREQCYEIMRAVGGGSTQAGVLNVKAIKDLMVSYRTITGDVLAGDDGATKLLLEGRAMFTKFPLEMNFPLTREKEQVLEVKEYFEGRSLPRSLCKRRLRYSKWRENEVFVPGMGGCWDQDGDATPGLGESGAVMITCEQWDTVGTQELAPDERKDTESEEASGRSREEKKLGEADEGSSTETTWKPGSAGTSGAQRPDAQKSKGQEPKEAKPQGTKPGTMPEGAKSAAGETTAAGRRTTRSTTGGAAAGSGVRHLKIEKPKPAPKPKPQPKPAPPEWPAKKKYLYCPWYAWWTIGSGHYSCMGGLQEYEEVFKSEEDYEYFLAKQFKVRQMSGCDDKQCIHFEEGYTNNRYSPERSWWKKKEELDKKYKRGMYSKTGR